MKSAGRYKKFLTAMPPISLAYVAAALHQHNIPLAAYDDFLNMGDNNQLHSAIKREKPDIIGISCLTASFERVVEIGTLIRSQFPGIKIVMGNNHADLFARDILARNLADFVVHGEAEVTFPELLKKIENKEDIRQCKGVSFHFEGQYWQSELRAGIEDLDSLPFPAWDYFDLGRYELFSFARIKKPAGLILGSRGCTFKCNFCSLRVMGTTRRTRSPANIAAEFEHMHEKYGLKQLSFVDPIYPMNKREMLALRDELVGRGLHKKMVWTTETRVDLMNDEIATAMADSGCRRVMFGFETGNNETQKNIEKRATVERARRAVRSTKKAGMQVIGFFMIGVPGDTHQTIRQTARFAARLGIEFAKFTVFVPYPGTDIFKELRQKKQLENYTNWSGYTSYPTRENPVLWTTEGLSNDDLIQLQKYAFRKFYLRFFFILRHLFILRTFRFREMFGGLKVIFGNRARG